MSPTRGDRAAPPPGPDEWDIRFANGEAAKGWEQLGAQAAGKTRAAWHLMRTDPAPAARTERHHRLKGELARGEHRGETMDRWQIEVTAGGRVWYLLDVERARSGSTAPPPATPRPLTADRAAGRRPRSRRHRQEDRGEEDDQQVQAQRLGAWVSNGERSQSCDYRSLSFRRCVGKS